MRGRHPRRGVPACAAGAVAAGLGDICTYAATRERLTGAGGNRGAFPVFDLPQPPAAFSMG